MYMYEVRTKFSNSRITVIGQSCMIGGLGEAIIVNYCTE